MGTSPLHVLVFGAHPDDCDIKAGGPAVKYARLGHKVCFVSMTDGAAGHHEIGGVELAKRRFAEAQAAARVAGIEYILLGNHDGELEASLENRQQVVEMIRAFRPDLILAPRPNDYHPDHRSTSILVQDASYLVTVPNYHPLVPHLRRMPVIVYVSDGFSRPNAFRADMVVDIDDVIELKMDMLDCHVSQMYEWLPYNAERLDEVPEGAAERRAWLAENRKAADARIADRFRERLEALYGTRHGSEVRYAEAFEVCEYGAPLTEEARERLFPFFGAG